jgi:hypothetical protein
MFRCTKDRSTTIQDILLITGVILMFIGAAFTPKFESWPLCLFGAIAMLCGTWNVRGMGTGRFLASYALLVCVGQYLYVFSEAFRIPLAILWFTFVMAAALVLTVIEVRRAAKALPTMALVVA